MFFLYNHEVRTSIPLCGYVRSARLALTVDVRAFSSLRSDKGLPLRCIAAIPVVKNRLLPAGGNFMSKGGNMNKIEEQIKRAEQELEQESRRLARLKNRKTYYENSERQKRTHRLITRRAAIESLAPEIKALGETEFFELAEKIFALPEVQNLIAKEAR